jgi:pimeloyl-ACP methyl ester carboxylesterase
MDDKLKFYKSVEGYEAMRSWYESLLGEFEVPVESLYVKTRFGNTHMLAAGPESGEPVILLQGVTGSAPLWRRQFPDLSREFRVFALDTVGQPGRSDPNPPSYLTDDHANWLVDVMDGLGLESAHFAGVSSGGNVVMQMAIAFPERVRKIVMISPTGLVRMRLPVKIWLQSYLYKIRDADALEDSLTARSVTRPRPGQTRDRQLARLMILASKHYRVDRSLGIYDEKSGRVDIRAGMRVLGKFLFAERGAVLRSCKAPVLLVLGEQELFYDPEKLAARAKASIPQLEVEIVPGASHGVISDRPELINPILTKFLRTPP